MTFTVNKISLFGGVAGILAVVVSMATNGGQSEQQSESVTTTVQVTDQSVADPSLQAEVQRLKKLLASKQSLLRNKTVELQRLSAQQAKHDDDSEMQDLSTDDAAEMMQFGETEEQAWADENMAVLDEALSKQTPDPEWRTMATGSIHEIMGSEALAGSELVSAECAATFCRVETRFQDQVDSDQFLNEFGFQISWSDSAFAKIIHHKAGGQTIVYYMSRDGHDLPLAEG